MFSPALSAFWLMAGYLILLVMLGVFTTKLGRMRGIKTRSGYLGAVFWLLGVLVYFILAQVGSPDVIILFAISIIIPIFYSVNLLAILLSKKLSWIDPDYKKKSLSYLVIFIIVLAIYLIGLIVA